VEEEQILEIVHLTAAEMMASKDGEVVKPDSMASTEGGDSLIDRYGFASIEALEYLLILEKKFEITFKDEDLAGEVLSSAVALTKRIVALQPTRTSHLGQ
jgi:acyl carrier protein